MTARSDDLQRNLIRALGQRRFECATGAALVRWADDALLARDATSLRILGGLAPPWNEFEVDSYLERAADELGIRLPAAEALLPSDVRILAEEMVQGSTAPFEGCERLHRLFTTLGFPESLSAWSGLHDVMTQAREGVFGSVEDAEERILEEAERIVAS